MRKPKEFGKRLRAERKRLKLTQQEFGELGGVRRATQYLYERGERNPDAEYLRRLAHGGVDMLYLFSDGLIENGKTIVCIDLTTLTQVLAMVDKISRDKAGRLLDVEHRNALTIEMLTYIHNKGEDSQDWEELESRFAS